MPTFLNNLLIESSHFSTKTPFHIPPCFNKKCFNIKLKGVINKVTTYYILKDSIATTLSGIF